MNSLSRARTAYETAVNKELDRLSAEPRFRKTMSKRRSTIRLLADAEAHPGQNMRMVFEARKTDEQTKAAVVSPQIFYSKKKDWIHHPLFAEVYDNVVRLAREYEEGKDAREREAEREAWKERMAGIATKGASKLETMLDFPIAKKVIMPDGKTIIEPTDKWSVGNIAPLMTAVDKVGRMALDMDTDKTAVDVEMSGEVGGEVADVRGSIMSKFATMRQTIQGEIESEADSGAESED